MDVFLMLIFSITFNFCFTYSDKELPKRTEFQINIQEDVMLFDQIANLDVLQEINDNLTKIPDILKLGLSNRSTDARHRDPKKPDLSSSKTTKNSDDDDKEILDFVKQTGLKRIVKSIKQMTYNDLVFVLKAAMKAADESQAAAAFYEFITDVRAKWELFEDDILKYSKITQNLENDNVYRKYLVELNKKYVTTNDKNKNNVKGMQENQRGKHYRKCIVALHFGDERGSEQLEYLRELLEYNRSNYNKYCWNGNRFYGVLSIGHHAYLLRLKYVSKDAYKSFINNWPNEDMKYTLENFVESANSKKLKNKVKYDPE